MNDSLSKSGRVDAWHLLDGQPDRIIQGTDAAVYFDVPLRSKVTLELGGHGVPLDPPRSYENTTSPSILRYILTKDDDADGRLDLDERIGHLGEVFTNNLNRSTPAVPKTKVYNSLEPGKYFLYLAIHDIPTTSYPPGSTNFPEAEGPSFPIIFDLAVRRQQLAAPAVAVSGNGVLISSNDTSPSTSDGTSFGTRDVDAALPQMTFSVRNSGPSGAPALKGSVTAGGDFEVINGLPSAGVARNATDDIVVRLRNSRSSPGAKTGTVTIDPTEPGVPNFTFAVGGTITEPPPPRPDFASLVSGTLTVTGTSGNDSILMLVSGGNLVVTRNGQPMSFSASAITAGIVVNALDGDDGVSSSATVTMRQTLNGGAGRDTLRGGKGSDLLNGQDGVDYLDGGGRGDVISGGAGPDTVRYNNRTLAVDVTLDGVANDGQAGEGDNVLLDVEHVIGGAGDDRIVGNGLRNRLRGGPGNDTLLGFSREDTLIGEAGDDLLDGGNAVDVLDGGDGNNVLRNA